MRHYLKTHVCRADEEGSPPEFGRYEYWAWTDGVRDAIPRTKSDFYRMHLANHRRLADVYAYLAPEMRLLKTRGLLSGRILSLGCGRFALEMALQELLGIRVLCTERDSPPWLESTRALFGEAFEFLLLDMIRDEPPAQDFGAVLCLGVAFLFDEHDMRKLMQFAWKALSPSGFFFLELTGAPRSPFIGLFHDAWIPLERRVLALAKTLSTGRLHRVRRVPHGYYHDTMQVLRIAEAQGFVCEGVSTASYVLEFARSSVASAILSRSDWANQVLSALGKSFPFVRILRLRKR
jgi:SAM-dependent methyltransferase